MTALSLPLTDGDIDMFVGAFDGFLTARKALLV